MFKTSRRSVAAIAWLVPIFDLAGESGLVVPRLIRSQAGNHIENGWTCEAFISGAPFQPADMQRLRPRLLAFHAATKEVRQRPGFASAADLLHGDAGGDVDLRDMPPDVVALCRRAWSRIAGRPACIVHGDLNPGNLIWTEGGGVALLDWDECRFDAALFDSEPLGLSDADGHAKAAIMAWEAACSWRLEPAYAIEILKKLRGATP